MFSIQGKKNTGDRQRQGDVIRFLTNTTKRSALATFKTPSRQRQQTFVFGLTCNLR